MNSPNARACAARVVHEVVFAGRSLDVALAHAFTDTADISPRDMPLAQEMSYGTLRWLERLKTITGHYLRKPLKDKDGDLAALLWVGLYQLLFLEVPAHAAVHETVAATASLGKPWARNLVNAVLRAVLREDQNALDTLAHSTGESRFSHPAWLLGAIQHDWPDDWQRIAVANNERPPLSLRVNIGKIGRERYLAKLREAGITCEAVGESQTAVTLTEPIPVEHLPGFRDGEVSVQDVAAQCAAPALGVVSGERVLDACAAPGGKLAHLLEQGDTAEVVGLDVDADRLRRVEDNLRRLGLGATLLVGDASRPAEWWDGRAFDRILIDAPCSGTGVIRRHPDIKVHRRRQDIERLSALQGRIVAALWSLLKPGGRLLYATCSILKEENEQQMRRFMIAHADAVAREIAIPGSLARPVGHQILPGERGMDGFYYACLQKQQKP